MSARLANACLACLRFRRHLDVGAVTVWFGVITGLMIASAAALAAA